MENKVNWKEVKAKTPEQLASKFLEDNGITVEGICKHPSVVMDMLVANFRLLQECKVLADSLEAYQERIKPYAKGLTYKDIADTIGMSEPSVRFIIGGRP